MMCSQRSGSFERNALNYALFIPVIIFVVNTCGDPNQHRNTNSMKIIQFETGPLETCSYLLIDEQTSNAVLVDCPPGILGALEYGNYFDGLNLNSVILTHGHWDHMSDAADVKERSGASILVHRFDEDYLLTPGVMSEIGPPDIKTCTPDGYLTDNQTIDLGESTFRILLVPGHTPGHIALYHEASASLFSGDVLFLGSIGRTDFRGGNYDTLMKSISEKILSLPDETMVYPGHGPATTVGRERNTNPFILDYFAHY